MVMVNTLSKVLPVETCLQYKFSHSSALSPFKFVSFEILGKSIIWYFHKVKQKKLTKKIKFINKIPSLITFFWPPSVSN